MSKKKMHGAVVVITGASSGIGRATAISFARQGANLVLAARDEEALLEAAAECALAGGRAIAVPTDVTDPKAVHSLAKTAAQTYSGRIDVWVNNAGIGAVGGFLETPVGVHDRVIQTNLLGYIHGAHAALPYFKQQHEGVLINNISFGAWFPAPYAVAYSASKYGVMGYSEALRGELHSWPGIHVCDLFPFFVNTPGLPDHAANYSGHKLRGSNKASSPYRVAEAIVALAEYPRDSLTLGSFAYLAKMANSVSPKLSRRFAARTAEAIFNFAEKAPTNNGALFEPRRNNKRIHGIEPGSRRGACLAAAGAAIVFGFLASHLLTSGSSSASSGHHPVRKRHVR